MMEHVSMMINVIHVFIIIGPKSCYNSCKCVEHEGTPKELISKQLNRSGNPGDDNMYADITGRRFSKDENVTFSNATHFRCYADSELVNYAVKKCT